MSQKLTSFFASRLGIIVVGACIGICAALLQMAGNPPNMGVCVACFQRDIAGALGFHRAAVVQYLRPEIIGFVLGALIAALAFKEFKATAGSAPIVRFTLGIFAMIGSLVFLGCPWRAILRLAGGDLNAIIGLIGLALGVTIGVQFLKAGYNLGRSYQTHTAVGYILPLIMVTFLIFLLVKPGFIFFSEKGPGAMHAPIGISLGAGLLIGFLAQRTRFCTMGSIRDVVLMGDTHLISGVGAMVIAAFIVNMVLGSVTFGLASQPIAHSSHLWNFLGMVLAGLAFALAGGCPGRQLFLAGEGNSDSSVFVLGMIVGAGVAHNFILAGKPDKIVDGVLQVGGISTAGMIAVIIGIAFCVFVGFTMRDRM